MKSLLKSILHNLGVTVVSAMVPVLGLGIDGMFGWSGFRSTEWMIAGAVVLIAGFLLRTWAAYAFYEHRMQVIVLEPQSALVTTGAFGISRNPLYLGGNVFMFLGASLIAGSPGGIALTVLGLIPTDLMSRREEKQLEAKFGAEWTAYTKRVRRWI